MRTECIHKIFRHDYIDTVVGYNYTLKRINVRTYDYNE